ncbi:MAG: hypothetical protein SRB1_00584 [Desulfobacteraceae bacterium Eth-SRB1]|nr:MAG: hypothetical protein SRB1_00584 [Desulfobacteraceae bacterium Eth-SRB1]
MQLDYQKIRLRQRAKDLGYLKRDFSLNLSELVRRATQNVQCPSVDGKFAHGLTIEK